MSISWGIKDRFKFTPAGALTSWDPPPIAAVYAITYRQNADRPKSHTVLYFGQAENLAAEAPDLNRRVMDSWAESGNDVHGLAVFIHAMPGSTSGQRSRVQEQLMAEYRPQANR